MLATQLPYHLFVGRDWRAHRRARHRSTHHDDERTSRFVVTIFVDFVNIAHDPSDESVDGRLTPEYGCPYPVIRGRHVIDGVDDG